jgi:hypothetical protein
MPAQHNSKKKTKEQQRQHEPTTLSPQAGHQQTVAAQRASGLTDCPGRRPSGVEVARLSSASRGSDGNSVLEYRLQHLQQHVNGQQAENQSTGDNSFQCVPQHNTNTLKQHRAGRRRRQVTPTEHYQQATPSTQTPEEGRTIRPDQAPARPTATATTTLTTTTSFETNQQQRRRWRRPRQKY